MPSSEGPPSAETAVVDAILDRRSVRSGFEARPIPRTVLERVLECGLAAPSSKGARPWRFHVVEDPVRLASLATAVRSARGADDWIPHDPRTGRPDPRWTPTVGESADVLQGARAVILIENLGVFSRGRAELARTPARRLRPALDGYTFECVGIGAALENLWLAAHALGLGAAFLGDVVIAEEGIAEELGLSGDLIGALCLGYASGPAPTRPLRDAADPSVVWH